MTLCLLYRTIEIDSGYKSHEKLEQATIPCTRTLYSTVQYSRVGVGAGSAKAHAPQSTDSIPRETMRGTRRSVARFRRRPSSAASARTARSGIRAAARSFRQLSLQDSLKKLTRIVLYCIVTIPNIVLYSRNLLLVK